MNKILVLVLIGLLIGNYSVAANDDAEFDEGFKSGVSDAVNDAIKTADENEKDYKELERSFSDYSQRAPASVTEDRSENVDRAAEAERRNPEAFRITPR